MPDVIDKRWFDKIEVFMPETNEIEGKLRAPLEQRAAQRELFEQGQTDNPDLRPQLDVARLGNLRQGLEALKDEIGEQADTLVAQAYLPRIDELVSNVDTLEGATTGNPDLFERGNIGRFGEPDTMVFLENVTFARGLALEAHTGAGFVKEQAKTLLEQLPEADTPTAAPAADEFEKVQRLYKPVFDEIESVLGPIGKDVTGEQAVGMLQTIVDHFGFGYQVVAQKPGLHTMAVSHSEKQVLIPLTETYSKERFMGLAVHEIWIHVNEAIQGKTQPLLLLQRGLSRALFSGEGKGLVAEQVAYRSMDDFLQTPRSLEIVRRHLSIGLARGLSGQKQNFREVYSAINALDIILARRRGARSLSDAQMIANEQTWELLSMRTLKGLTGKGMASVQDKVYAEGCGPQRQLQAQRPEVFPYLNLGKYNLLDKGHVAVLCAIGTLPTTIDLA